MKRRERENDLEREIRDHLALEAEEQQEAGLPPQDARFAAQRAFGNVALALEDSRAEWRFAWLGSLAQDLRYALRGFRKSPGFALTVTGTLALGLGTLATAFSMFNATVLRPYAVRDPYSLYSFLWRGRNAVHYGSWQDFSELRKQRTVFSEILAYYPGNASIAGRPLRVVAVSGNYFDMLGGQPCLGRVLGNADERPGTAVAVASYAAWKGRLHGDPGAIGRTSYVGGQPVTLVGVACPGFTGIGVTDSQQLWVSLPLAGALAGGPDLFGAEQPDILRLVGRLKPGLKPEAARPALLAYGQRASEAWPRKMKPERVDVESAATQQPLTPQAVMGYLPVFLLFGLVLLIACANVSNMTLARALARQREIGIRLSLGASRGRVVRQLLTESLLLAVPSALAAFALANGGAAVLVLTVSRLQSGSVDFGFLAPDARVLAFLLISAVVSTVALSLMPALQATRAGLVQATRGEFGNDRRPARLRNSLVVFQVMVCVLLLVLAGTAFHAERRAAGRETGVDPRGAFSLEVHNKFRARVEAQLRGEPMVESVGAVSVGFFSSGLFVPAGQTVNLAGDRLDLSGMLRSAIVSPEYFGILRIPLVRGRNFTESEASAESAVTIVSESAARRLWPGQEPLGKAIAPDTRPEYGRPPVSGPALVVGVARDVHVGPGHGAGAGLAAPLLYFPTSPRAKRGTTLIVRMRGESGAARRALDAAAGRAGPDLVDEIRSAEESVRLSRYLYEILLIIIGALGGLALLLTASGVYGVLSYVVAQRRKEFGIRIALGADGGDVTRMVFRHSFRLALAGTAAGLILAAGVAKVLSASVEGLQAFDLGGWAGGAAVALAAAAAATWAPALRAVRVDPAVTLRCD